MKRVSAAREQLCALVSLGCVQPKFSVERSVAAIEAIGGAEAAPIIGRQRTRSIVMPRLAPFEASCPAVRECAAALRPRAVRKNAMHTDLPGNLERLSRLAAGLGIELLAFKGLGARATYPDPGLRDFND